MSTTVSYKGQTLATVSNQTKTLLTEGKYLEDDITLVDVSGGGAVLGTKNITANGTYEAEDDSLDGYSEVTVAVPNSYSAGDEGKVVSNGALVAQTSDTVTANDTYDTTLINSLTVNVSGGGGSSKETGSFVVSGASVRSFTIPVTAQHTHVQVVIHGFTGSTDLSTAPYGANHLIYVCMDDTLKIYTAAATNYDGKNTTAGIGRGFPDYASFGASSITSGDVSVGGSARYMVDGATYDWEAW